MSFSSILYGPDSEAYNLYGVASPAPGDNGIGGPIAYRAQQPLGKQLVLEDGRKFRFALNGGTLLVVANVIQGAAALATSEDNTAAAGAVDDRIITFTHGAATTVVNFYAEGYANISVTPGGGDCYKIASHAALTNATAGDVVNLAPGNALRRALTTTSRMDLVRHPYHGTLQAASAALTGAPVGVAVSAIAADESGWLQTRGAAGVLSNGTLLHGRRAIAPGAAAAGAASPETPDVAESDVEVTLGTVLAAAATTAWSTVFLMIDG